METDSTIRSRILNRRPEKTTFVKKLNCEIYGHQLKRK
jgi:hypothetical protein